MKEEKDESVENDNEANRERYTPLYRLDIWGMVIIFILGIGHFFYVIFKENWAANYREISF